MNAVSIVKDPIDPAQLGQSLRATRSGGYCAFEGWVRDRNDGRRVAGLFYEAYPALALAEGEKIIGEAMARFPVDAARCVHRTGQLALGDIAVWVGVAAEHRDAAFQACRYIIDEIKHRLPIWKKEQYVDGESAWVLCTHAGHGTAPAAAADEHRAGHAHHAHAE